MKEEEERKAQEELERKAQEVSSSAAGQVRASLEKGDKPAATAKLLNSFPVENGPAQRMSYLMEVHHSCKDVHLADHSVCKSLDLPVASKFECAHF